MILKLKKLIYAMCIICFLPQVVFAQENTINEGVKLYEENRFDEAKRYFVNLIKQYPNHEQGLLYLGRLAFKGRDFDEAKDILETCTDLYPNNAQCWSWLGRTCFVQAERAGAFSAVSIAKKGRDAFLKSLELDPNNIRDNLQLSNFYIYAPGLVGGGNDKALAIAKKLSSIDETASRLILFRIDLDEDKKIDAAHEYKVLAEAIGDNPIYSSFYNDYGYYLLNQDQYKMAIIQFIKLTELEPTVPNSYDSLGDGYQAAGLLNKARNAYLKALEIDPDFSLSKKNLKKVEKALKKLAKK